MNVQVAAVSSIKTEQASLLFTTITSLKYKLVLHLLKEDGRNRSDSVYNDIIKFFNTYYYKIPVYTVEVVTFNQTELEAEGRVVEQLFLIAFLKTSLVALKFLYISYLFLLLILYDLPKNFLLLKIYEKISGESFFKM